MTEEQVEEEKSVVDTEQEPEKPKATSNTVFNPVDEEHRQKRKIRNREYYAKRKTEREGLLGKVTVVDARPTPKPVHKTRPETKTQSKTKDQSAEYAVLILSVLMTGLIAYFFIIRPYLRKERGRSD